MGLAIEKKIVTDENAQPVAVQISYRDWLEIEAILANQPQFAPSDISKLQRHKGVIRLRIDPMEFQKQAREEWN